MFFLIQLELGENTRITLGYMQASSPKACLKKTAEFLQKNKIEAYIENGHVSLGKNASVQIIRVDSLLNNRDALELAKKLLKE